MTAEQLMILLDAVPYDAKVYFRLTDEFASGDELGASVFQYNSVTNEVVLSWDAEANYEDF